MKNNNNNNNKKKKKKKKKNFSRCATTYFHGSEEVGGESHIILYLVMYISIFRSALDISIRRMLFFCGRH